MPCSVALADFLIHSPTFLVTAITRRDNQSQATDFGREGAHFSVCKSSKLCAQCSGNLFTGVYGVDAQVNVPHEVLQLQRVCPRTQRRTDKTDKNTADVDNPHPVHAVDYLCVRLKVRKWFTVPTRKQIHPRP